MPTEIAPELLALQRLYAWEKEAPTRVALTQPMGDGSVRDFTWSELAGEVRRMAGHLQSIGIQPGDKVAILSKNCAWWLMSDLAIWMAGGVSVPLYPTLAPDTIAHILKQSEARACCFSPSPDIDVIKIFTEVPAYALGQKFGVEGLQ